MSGKGIRVSYHFPHCESELTLKGTSGMMKNSWVCDKCGRWGPWSTRIKRTKKITNRE